MVDRRMEAPGSDPEWAPFTNAMERTMRTTRLSRTDSYRAYLFGSFLLMAGAVTLAAFVVTPVFAQGVAQGSSAAANVSDADRPLSRAEVIADLRLWRRAGVDNYADLALSYQVRVEEYQKALAVYKRLRAGPEYVAELAAVSKELGDAAM